VVQLRWQKVALDRGQLVSEVAIISLNLYKTLEIELLLLGERTLVTKGVKLHAEALFHILHRSDVLPSIVGTHWLIRSWRLRLNDVDLRPTVLFHELLVGHLNKHVLYILLFFCGTSYCGFSSCFVAGTTEEPPMLIPLIWGTSAKVLCTILTSYMR
jgi:hypothetical protein